MPRSGGQIPPKRQFVVGYSEEDNENLKILLERGKQNGVRDLALIDGETVRAAEPHLSQRITCALSAPTGAVVCPYELTLHAIGHAMDYGADFLTNFAVSALHCSDEDAGGKATSTAAAAETQAVPGGYRIEAADGRQVWAKIVLNCAGLYSDEIAAMIGDTFYDHAAQRRISAARQGDRRFGRPHDLPHADEDGKGRARSQNG